jgi:glycerophosphoryl diester phosphodiesterase
MKPLVIAHRGASAYAPENTLSAFNLAYEMGADGIELDVQLTKDGVPVVFHSESLHPTYSIRSLKEIPLDQVQQIDIGARFNSQYRGERIPTLAQVLDAVGARGKIIVELKRAANETQNDGREQAAAKVIQQAANAKNVIVSSFHPITLYRVRKLLPTLPRAFTYHKKIYPRLLHGFWFRLLTRPQELHIDEQMATLRYVQWAKRKGYRVVVYHPDEPEEMRRIIALGVDAIMSNKPDVLRRVVDETFSRSTKQ